MHGCAQKLWGRRLVLRSACPVLGARSWRGSAVLGRALLAALQRVWTAGTGKQDLGGGSTTTDGIGAKQNIEA